MSHSLSVFHPGSVGIRRHHRRNRRGMAHQLQQAARELPHPDRCSRCRRAAGIEIVRLLYPAPVLRKLEISETKMALYDGVVVFGAIVRIGENVAPGSYRITATLRYQGCNDLTCVEPASASADDTIRVGTLEEAVEQLDGDLFSKPPFVGEDGQPVGVEARRRRPGTSGT